MRAPWAWRVLYGGFSFEGKRTAGSVAVMVERGGAVVGMLGWLQSAIIATCQRLEDAFQISDGRTATAVK